MPNIVSAETLAEAIEHILRSIPESAYLSKKERLEFANRGVLPHTALLGKLQHITWRTADSIPQEMAHALFEEYKDLCKNPDGLVDKAKLIGRRDWLENKITSLVHEGLGECLLSLPENREPLSELLTQMEISKGEVFAFAIMPNHVHLAAINNVALEKLMKYIKGASSIDIRSEISDTAGKEETYREETEKFWHKNYYDRMMRSANQLKSTLYYIINNPRCINHGEYTIWIKGLGEIQWHPSYLNWNK